MLDLFVCNFAMYNHYTAKYFPWMPHVGFCHGHPMAAWFGIVVLSSYLVLFILCTCLGTCAPADPAVYRDTYRKSAQKLKSQAATKKSQ